MPPGPAFRYLYEHQHAKSTSQSCKRMGTFPTACAQSKPTMQPCTRPASQGAGIKPVVDRCALTLARPARVIASMSNHCPV